LSEGYSDNPIAIGHMAPPLRLNLDRTLNNQEEPCARSIEAANYGRAEIEEIWKKKHQKRTGD